MKTNNKGFTLIELVMVIAIIGILSAVALPKFVDLQVEAKKAASKGALGAIRSVLAIKYAASATAGGAATYPGSLAGTDFADNQLPKNPINTFTGIGVVTSAPTGTATSTDGFWYIATGASAGRAGAYSDGTINTSDF